MACVSHMVSVRVKTCCNVSIIHKPLFERSRIEFIHETTMACAETDSVNTSMNNGLIKVLL